VYTGDGKGKTTATLGLSLRAVGHNFRVYIIQFMKGGDTGEMFGITKYLPNVTLVQFGKDAMKEKQLKIAEYQKGKTENSLKENEKYRFPSDKQEKDAAHMGFDHAKKIVNSGEYDIVILDEINCVMSKEMGLPIEWVLDLIKNKPEEVELVLTGRHAPKEIMEVADLVSHIQKIKHPFDKGVLARKGIEY